MSLDVTLDHSTNAELSSSGLVSALNAAVGENWLLGMTDYRIFSVYRFVSDQLISCLIPCIVFP